MRKNLRSKKSKRSLTLPQLLTIVASFFLLSGIVAGKKAIESSLGDTRSQAASQCIQANPNGRTQINSPGGTLCNENFTSGVDIVGNDTTLNCNGVTIDGNNNTDSSKSGISIVGRTNVTISGCSVKGFFAGLYAEDSSNVTIENSTFSQNSIGGQDHDWLADLMTKPDTGGGIMFINVQNSKIIQSNASQNIAGASLFDSKNIEVSGGNYSSNTGWGVRLIRTSDSKVSGVNADNNNRVNSQCQGGGCESAGILLMENSNRNRIENNSLNNGGDGFYINGNGGVPSNNNIVIGNTANAESKFASGNGFEATFSEGNVFERNTSKGHNYGFWLGYSEKSVINNNTVEAVRGGISIPASKCNAVINNTTQNGEPAENHIFTESQDMHGISRFCRDNYLSNNSPALDTDSCTNTSAQPIASCNLNLTPVPTSPDTSPSPTANRLLYGIGPSLGRWYSPAKDASWENQMLDKIQSACGNVLRTGLDWAQIEPNAPSGGQHTYSWDNFDRIVNGARNRNIEVVGLLVTSPGWANGGNDGDPHLYPPTSDHTEDYKSFLKALVARYSGKITRYEFWNEANNCGWHPGCGGNKSSKAQEYIKWQKVTYETIKSADASLLVSTTGMDGADTEFLSELYELSTGENSCSGKPCWDRVAVHAYGGNGSIDFGGLDSVRQLMQSKNDASPIWITEYGLSTSDTARTSYIEQTLETLASSNYSFVEIANYLVIADTPQTANWGIVKEDLADTQSFTKFQSIACNAPSTITPSPTPRTGGGPTSTPPPGRAGITTLRIEVWVTRDGVRRRWSSQDGEAQVYISGPTARGPDRFSVIMS
ncbi:right-handed parallel beta-helix repeat-containing protein, partial [Candidatus Gottesmanbacteria bacterium]|nr:right-handed parallel beta-helix repeat-containing protein [Candidatus Gottesmanbacteria bacterium]